MNLFQVLAQTLQIYSLVLIVRGAAQLVPESGLGKPGSINGEFDHRSLSQCLQGLDPTTGWH